MSDVKLSICIPTYNFDKFIGETLKTIIAQAGDEVEIVIGDGASTDNTEDVVRGYQLSFTKLYYHKFEKKGGIDLDLARTVALSRGDYCWLMSSDDVLKPGAILRMLNEIKLGHDVYLCNRLFCDLNLKPKVKESWLSDRVSDQVFHFTDKSQLIDYLNSSRSTGALFSYISSVVVNRKEWSKIGYDVRFSESNYAHVFRLFSVLKISGNSLKYIKDSLVLCRGNNDSFIDKGLANRALIDFDGYQHILDSLFFDEDVRKAFKAVMRRQRNCLNLAIIKSESVDDSKWNDLEKKLSYYNYSGGELFVINILGLSKKLISLLRSVKKLCKFSYDTVHLKAFI